MTLQLLVQLLLLGLVVVCEAVKPIAKHQLVVVENGESLIKLGFRDESGVTAYFPEKLVFTIDSIPEGGRLFQLSHVFSVYGNEPKAGVEITNGGTVVTGSGYRLLYRHSPTMASNTDSGKLGKFEFSVGNGEDISYKGTITLVPPSGNIVGSEFLFDSEGWTVTGNRNSNQLPSHESFSKGNTLNHYIISSDDKINVESSSSSSDGDSSLWYFNAPGKFSGNLGISYRGYLKFTLGAFSGDFSSTNPSNTPLVKLYCADCPGPVGLGNTLIFPISKSPLGSSFTGEASDFSIQLHEEAGWLKDPQNTLMAWTQPTQCDIIQVLSRLTSVEILGDWTTRYENLALDNVYIYRSGGKDLPLCAMSIPDASICSCA